MVINNCIEIVVQQLMLDFFDVFRFVKQIMDRSQLNETVLIEVESIVAIAELTLRLALQSSVNACDVFCYRFSFFFLEFVNKYY